MRFDHHYRREHVVDVDAATVGISRLRWASVTPEQAADPEATARIMAENQFDIMPVAPPGDSADIEFYVRTKTWGNYAEVERRSITPADRCSQRTPLEEVIRAFAVDDRDFFFLTSYGRITGLVTVVNLNCRQARVYVYGLICEAEVALGNLIRSAIEAGHFTPSELLGKLSDNRDDVRQNFAEASAEGFEPDVTEFLYLTDLIKAVRWYDLHEALGYETKGAFKRAFAHLNETRKRVAHPTRALVEKRGDVKKLWQDISTVERALARLAAA